MSSSVELLPEFPCLLLPEHLTTMSQLDEKLTYIERRAMNDNMKPAELVRQIGIVLDTYMPRGDPCWLMRTIREAMLAFFRALSMRYQTMNATEKYMMCRACLFEACKRHANDIGGNLEKRRKYELILDLCRETEKNEKDYLTHLERTDFFVYENLSLEDLIKGYEACNAYKYLKRHASVEAIFELKTILHENYDTKIKNLQAITDKYLEAMQQP